MTVSGVERTLRAAYPSPAPPTGVSTPLPPPIQGAERRSENHARRTGLRWGLRVLAVGGLAGAAWLLTGSAAQAADRADGPDGSLLGSLVGADAGSPVFDLLQAAAQPLESTEPAPHEQHLVYDILDVPRPVLTSPDTDDDVEHEPFATIVDVVPDVDEVADEVAAPLRPAGGEAAPEKRHHHTAHAVATEPEDSTPGGDAPAAPLRPRLGEVDGTPAGGPGTPTPTEGGSAAFLPAAIANSTVARHVPAIAPDVEVRRYDAEAPTVSPD